MRICLLFLLLPLCYAAHARKKLQPKPELQKKVDSLLIAYKQAKTDTARLSALIQLTDTYEDQSNFKDVLLYNDLKIKLSARLKLSKDSLGVLAGKKGEASYYVSMGVVSKKQGNSRQAISYFLRALNLCASLHDDDDVAVVLSNIASTYSQMGNYSESLLYSFKALKQKEKLGSKDQAAVELNNIGAIYCDIHNYSKALFYFTKARDISRRRNDPVSTALYTGNIGHCYQLLCDSAFEAGNEALSLELQEKALGYYFAALTVSEEASDLDNAAVCLENIGIIYSNVYDHEKALPYLLRALEMYKTLGLKAEESYCQVMLGEAYRGLGQMAKAESAYTQALALAAETHSNYYLMEANLGNSEFYERTNRPDKALNYYKAYILYRDSIFNTEKVRALAHTELNYEFEKKEAALKFENDKIVYQLESDNKLHRQWRLFFMVAIGLGVIVLLIAKRAYDNKKKLAAMLAAEDQRKDVLLQEVHHRINNNLQIISSLLTLQADHAENEKLSEYLVQSQNRIQALSAMHELLYDTDSPLEINMKEYLNKVLDFHRGVAGSLPVPVMIEEDIASVFFPTKLAVPIALIVNELVTNSLKYAFAGKADGLVKVSLAKKTGEDKWELSVSDNGRGLPEEGDGRKDSLGLRLVHIMTRQIKGTFLPKNARGASFSLIFELVK